MKNLIRLIVSLLLICLVPSTVLAIPPGLPQIATQAEMEAGTSTSLRSLTPTLVKQAIAGWLNTNYWVDITKYGADPTYTSDSTTAIQAAWAALPTYGVLFIPYGQYKVTSALVFDGNKHAIIIWYGRVRYAGAATNIDVISIGDGSTVQTDVHIFGNVHLTSATEMTSNSALRIKGGSRVTIESAVVGSKDEAATKWWNGIYLDQPDGIWINGGEVRALNDGVRISGDALGSADVYFSNFKFSKVGKTDGTSTGAALHIGGGFGGLKFTNTQFLNNTKHVLVDQTLVAVTNRELDFSGAQFDSASKALDNTFDGTAIQLTRTCTARFDNIWLASFGVGINIGSSFAGRVDINGGRIYNGFAHGTALGDGIVTAVETAIINETGVIWRDIAGTMRKCTSGTAASAWSYALAIQEGTIGAENSNLAVSAQTLPINGNLDVKGTLVVGATNPATITPDGSSGFSVAGPIGASAFTSTAADGSRRIAVTNNSAINPTVPAMEIYPEASIWKANQNGTESSIVLSPTAGQITFSGSTAPRTKTISDVAATIVEHDSTNMDVGAVNMITTGYIQGGIRPIVITTASGTDSASSAAAFLTHADDGSASNAYVGMTLYNITDASSCTITASTNTTMTCTLAGGTDNHWDSGNAYQVGPGPKQNGSWIYVTNASTIRHPATVGYAVCYESDAAAVLTIDMASESMIFQGTLDAAVVALDAGDSIDSSGSTTGDYMCIHNKSATEAQGKGKRGKWADGGAS